MTTNKYKCKVLTAKQCSDGPRFLGVDFASKSFEVMRNVKIDPVIETSKDLLPGWVYMVSKPQYVGRVNFSKPTKIMDLSEGSADILPAYVCKIADDFDIEVVERKITWGNKDGATCIKCRKHFEYAESVFGFECWACRNGY